MVSSSKILKAELKLVKPDFIEKRHSNRLLIWKNIPHWMVVDEDLYSLLEKLDGRIKTEGILCSQLFLKLKRSLRYRDYTKKEDLKTKPRPGKKNQPSSFRDF